MYGFQNNETCVYYYADPLLNNNVTAQTALGAELLVVFTEQTNSKRSGLE